MSPNNRQAIKLDAALEPDLELAILPAKDQTKAPTQLNKEPDPFLVTFSTPDPRNPKDWPTRTKWAVTDVLSAIGFNRIMVSTIMAPALTTIAIELHMSHIESIMALSIYLLATAFGPLVIGPLSEVYGREKILHVSNVWFVVWNIVCGFAKTKEVLIAARFSAGFGASSIYALAGGVLGDIWRPEQRGKSLDVYLLLPLLGAAVGPIIGGFVAGRTTWHWTFWSTSIFQAVMIAVSFTHVWIADVRDGVAGIRHGCLCGPHQQRKGCDAIFSKFDCILVPLFVPTMYGAMGYGWGNTAMAFASLILAVPGPIALWYYGTRL